MVGASTHGNWQTLQTGVCLFVFAFPRASCETFMRTLATPLLIIFYVLTLMCFSLLITLWSDIMYFLPVSPLEWVTHGENIFILFPAASAVSMWTANICVSHQASPNSFRAESAAAPGRVLRVMLSCDPHNHYPTHFKETKTRWASGKKQTNRKSTLSRICCA